MVENVIATYCRETPTTVYLHMYFQDGTRFDMQHEESVALLNKVTVNLSAAAEHSMLEYQHLAVTMIQLNRLTDSDLLYIKLSFTPELNWTT